MTLPEIACTMVSPVTIFTGSAGAPISAGAYKRYGVRTIPPPTPSRPERNDAIPPPIATRSSVAPPPPREDRDLEETVVHAAADDRERPRVVGAVEHEHLHRAVRDLVALALDDDPVRPVRRPVGHAAPRAAPAPPLDRAGRAEHLRVEADPRGLEEHVAVDLADVRAAHVAARDDARRLERIQRDPETLRDVHEAAEGEDPDGDIRIDDLARDGLQRPVAARDDDGRRARGHRYGC